MERGLDHHRGANGKKPAITIFTGGTAANSLVGVFNRVAEQQSGQLAYVIPISDNGGSSSELIRVIGGPSVGDLRSRLVRLIPTRENGEENVSNEEEMSALKSLFEHRLPSDPAKARMEWLDIIETRHLLWGFISSPKRELIRSILNTLNLEIVKRARPNSGFDFSRASIGNMFLTGARIFSGSLESAIYLLSVLCSIPTTVSVLPAINSNFTHHISAGLADGTSITGQVNISHPSAPTALPDDTLVAPALTAADHDRIEDANLPGSLPVLRRQHITFNKAQEEDLPSRIQRVWYINPYGHEIWPNVNDKVLTALQSSTSIIYSIGSLFTSIIPSLILRGVGSAISSPSVRHRILILNAKLDRETGPRSDPMTAKDFVGAVAAACTQTESPAGNSSEGGSGQLELRKYVSHLLYLEGKGAPEVDVDGLERLGIKCVRVAGRLVEEGKGVSLRYEEASLGEALERIIVS
ncbi:hypothetical protein B0T14DRAFT_562770 [Immersiella caudata]|uniref:Uncharacterized protein n=1 Tax=Immersiella caudata TaxID=314043 RepID=A0AA40C7D3_9PEZI|nr:hypothetical protein B0T14DRAFT_562770 [Immersiella caudata]